MDMRHRDSLRQILNNHLARCASDISSDDRETMLDAMVAASMRGYSKGMERALEYRAALAKIPASEPIGSRIAIEALVED